jgi:tetratricopeptide (TPR) repeat protein
LPRNQSNYWFDQPRKKFCAHVAQWPATFAELTRLKPDDEDLWIGNARYHSLHGRWQAAADEYARVEHTFPTHETVERAALLLLSGNEQGYRQMCLQMQQRTNRKLLWHCLHLTNMLALGSRPPVDPAQIVDWSTRAETGEVAPAWSRFRQFVLGLAQYRAGQLEQSRQRLEASKAQEWPPRSHISLAKVELVLAMIDYRQGNINEALARLDRVTDVLDKAIAYTADHPFHVPPNDWAYAHLFRREAEALILKQRDEQSAKESSNQNQ